MRAWFALAVLLSGLLSGCAGAGPTSVADVACPGHFHVALLVTHGEDAVPYYTGSPGPDNDASGPVQGVHMHADDGLLHVHPSVETCYTLAEVLHAVGVAVVPAGIEVDGESHAGAVRLDTQGWQAAWRTRALDDRHGPMPDATRVLLMVDPPADVDALRAQVPGIPPAYQPAQREA